ncbi:MAG TPA: type VI secretion system baseplate subunit TssF [Kofleriaceae bacterium]|nr:type VI secretion system baseplate subunit TssF [Kofleriaceae bacterium]
MTTSHDDYLAELAAVDDFFARRAGDGYVQREDPDVRRLVESIAFFAARTRQAAGDQLRRAGLQLARGFLDDFLSPQPARGLIQAVPAQFGTETTKLPAGTRLRITAEDGEVGLFSTMVDVTLRPLEIDFARVLPHRDGRRLVIRIRARRGVEITEPLSIYVGNPSAHSASLRLHYRLHQHATGAGVYYNAAPDAEQGRDECKLSFGSAPVPRTVPGPPTAIESLRTSLHFPDRELCFHVTLPSRPMRLAWLCIDLDDGWPADLAVSKDLFRLFVIPVENLVRDAAQPIKCDGTRARFRISPPAEHGLALHSVTGVFEETAQGRRPIQPVHLASADPSYDLDYGGDGLDPVEPHLVLRMPDAFTAPRLISVEARWHQPWFDDVALGKLDIRLQTRHIDGVQFQLLGMLTSHRPSPLWRDPAAMLRVLSRRASRVLHRRDLIHLMTLLGAGPDSHYAGIEAKLLRVDSDEELGDLLRGGGIHRVYRITVDDVPEEQLGLLDGYLHCVEQLLDAWSANPVRVERCRRTSAAQKRLASGNGA